MLGCGFKLQPVQSIERCEPYESYPASGVNYKVRWLRIKLSQEERIKREPKCKQMLEQTLDSAVSAARILTCLYDAQLQRFPQHVNGCHFPGREADTYLFVGDVNSPKINCPDGHFRGLSEADLPARFLRRQVRVLCTFGVPGWPQRHHLAGDRPARDYNTPGKS